MTESSEGKRWEVVDSNLDPAPELVRLRGSLPLPERVADASEVERLREQLEATEAWGSDGWAWLDDALKALGVETVFEIPAALHPDEDAA